MNLLPLLLVLQMPLPAATNNNGPGSALVFPYPQPHQLQVLQAYKKMPMRGRWDRVLRIYVHESTQTFDWGVDLGPIWFLDTTGIEYSPGEKPTDPLPEVVLKSSADTAKEFELKYGLIMYYSVLTFTEKAGWLPLDFAAAFVQAYDPGPLPTYWELNPDPISVISVKNIMGSIAP